MIAEPPLGPGVNTIVSCATPCVTAVTVGAVGVVAGVTDTVADAADEPTAFFAFTEQLYVVPFVKLETVMGLAVPVPLNCVAPDAHVAVYSVIAAVPVSAGGVKAIFADAFPAVASPIVGAAGALPVFGEVESPPGQSAATKAASKRTEAGRALMALIVVVGSIVRKTDTVSRR